MDGAQRAVPVDFAHLERVIERLVAERAVVRDAGVSDQQFNPAGICSEAIDRRFDRFAGANVALVLVMLAGQRCRNSFELIERACRKTDGDAALS